MLRFITFTDNIKKMSKKTLDSSKRRDPTAAQGPTTQQSVDFLPL